MKPGPSLDDVAALLLEADPIGLYFPDVRNTDEYDSEAAEIVARLRACSSYDECLGMIHDVFVRSFSNQTAGDIANYAGVAQKLWDLRSSGDSTP